MNWICMISQKAKGEKLHQLTGLVMIDSNIMRMYVTNHCGSFNHCGTEKVVR